MTWLYFVNFFFLQWFFIRLTKEIDDKGVILRWGIHGFIVPLSGWRSNFIYWGKWFIWL